MLIDITRLVDRFLQSRLPTGVDRVSLAYLHHFLDRASALVRFAGRWMELSRGDSKRVFTALLEGGRQQRKVILQHIVKAYVLSWRQHCEVLFNTGHSGLDRKGYRVEVAKRGLKPIFFLHDIIPVSHPEYCRAGEDERHHRRLDTMLSVGKGLIVNSAATRDELMAYAEEKNLKVPPCAVASLAPGRLPPPANVKPLGTPYFVALGTIEPRKNHLLLLYLWRQMVADMGDQAPRLVLIGQRGWECEQVVDLLDRCTALRGVVLEKTACNDQELATWLRHSRALLFPSFVEGFGMPLIEALMLGVPVIASRLPVFREIAGDIPDYLDPMDGVGWRQRILDYVPEDNLFRQAQLQRMQGYRPPTWKKHFEIVEELIEKIHDAP